MQVVMPIAVSGNFVWLQGGYFLSLHEQWPIIDGSIQAEAGIIFIFFNATGQSSLARKKSHFVPSITKFISGYRYQKLFHQIFFIVGII